MHNAFVRIRRKGAGQVYTYTIVFNAIKKEKKYAFLMGDFNVNTLNELKISSIPIYFLLIIIIN